MNVAERTVYLYHVTSKHHFLPVNLLGLLSEFSEGKRKAVWLVSKRAVSWAVEHTCREKGLNPEDLIIVRVRVRRSWLRKNKVDGVWYCNRDILPCRIEWIKYYHDGVRAVARHIDRRD